MSKWKGLYRTNAGDRAIIQRSIEEDNPNIFLNYYLRNNDSGTWFRPVSDEDILALLFPETRAAAQKWQDNYNLLFDIWDWLGKPDYYAPSSNSSSNWGDITPEEYDALSVEGLTAYRIVWQPDVPGKPVFHHRHGAILLDWQLAMTQNRAFTQVVVGGYGSGKTLAKALGMLWRGATLPGYRGFALAPYSLQSSEVYKQLLLIVQDTIFAERFLLNSPTKPFPHLVIGNDLVGKNSIECYPILDDPGKILTLTGDEALLDQAEKMDNGTLTDTIGKIASRFRGQVRGRPRRGQITLVANSADNPELWDYYDDAATDPDIWAYSPGTFENEYLTVADLKRFEKQVGRDEQSKRMYLFGERPLGSGEHFPRQSLEQCRARELDEIIRLHVEQKTPGWMLQRAQKVDIYRYRMPYEKGGRYIVAADPGWSNPPERNSPALAVWRIDGFPKFPAQLVAFEWVFGHGQPTPWMAMYRELVQEYHAIGMNGFDATGPQAGYERMEDFSDLRHTPVSMAGVKKYIYLNLAKKLFATSSFQIPTIPHLFSQLAKYTLPDDKIRQDIVSMILVTAALLEPYMYIEDLTPADTRHEDPNDRYQREEWLHEALEERY